ncbi:MAG: hypothetical protein LBU60_02015 [Clostridiales bacterium]|jgi:hypothetical protein|nr:hypothetical protein [Clostridiales bacterium]
MIIELSEGEYSYFLDCLKKFGKEKYCQLIKDSLIIDNAIVELGFMKHPTFTINIEIDKQNINEMLEKLDKMYEKGGTLINKGGKGKKANIEYEFEYNQYVDFDMILKMLT